MDILKFKEDINRTYVGIYAKGRISIACNRKGGEDGYRIYSGYIEVPYSYNDFTEFSPRQQEAICKAELCKSGWLYEFHTFKIDVDSFFNE